MHNFLPYDPRDPDAFFSVYSYTDNENITITVNKLEPSRDYIVTELISGEYIERTGDPMYGFEYWGTISFTMGTSFSSAVNDDSLRIFKITQK